jgi:hypothetical protein
MIWHSKPIDDLIAAHSYDLLQVITARVIHLMAAEGMDAQLSRPLDQRRTELLGKNSVCVCCAGAGEINRGKHVRLTSLFVYFVQPSKIWHWY